jgi:hypothetical protein
VVKQHYAWITFGCIAIWKRQSLVVFCFTQWPLEVPFFITFVSLSLLASPHHSPHSLFDQNLHIYFKAYSPHFDTEDEAECISKSSTMMPTFTECKQPKAESTSILNSRESPKSAILVPKHRVTFPNIMNIEVENYCKSKTVSCPSLQVSDPHENKSHEANKIATLNRLKLWNENI